MRRTLLIGSLVAVMLACSCHSNGREQTGRDGVQAVSDTLPRSGYVLSLPDVPPSLTAPEERAAYIIAHFWDGMDFGDTLRCRDRAFMEQNFVNYLSLFPHAGPETLPPHSWRVTSGLPMRTGSHRAGQGSPSPGRNPRKNSSGKDRKSTRLNSSHGDESRMPSSA